ncbi:MAG: HEAT repeat domain-containing protein, partial [Deltaproteobacteria bacterium]|nr:HEAT repeat domain-containing protein [Deltaproteobacteria bacterium]
MDVYRKLGALLESEDPRRRIAAAVVLGELKVKDAAVVSRLMEMAKDPLEPFATAALEALGAVGSLKALPVMMDALGRGGEAAQVAGRAIAALGPDALPDIRGRLSEATPEVKARLSQLLPAV